jgi:hypothetical protein
VTRAARAASAGETPIRSPGTKTAARIVTHRAAGVPAVGEARLEDLPHRPERGISPAVHDQK